MFNIGMQSYKMESEKSTIFFNQLDCIFGTYPQAFSTTRTFFGTIHKGNRFSVYFACQQCVAPANPDAGFAISAFSFNNVGDAGAFLPKHDFLINVNEYLCLENCFLLWKTNEWRKYFTNQLVGTNLMNLFCCFSVARAACSSAIAWMMFIFFCLKAGQNYIIMVDIGKS
jgi:hypothetical protein